MFSVFRKKTKWERSFLEMVFSSEQVGDKLLLAQLSAGLLRGVRYNTSDIPNYVSFLVDTEVLNQYFNPKLETYTIENILFWDKFSSQRLSLVVYAGYGTINGYSVSNPKKVDPDLSSIDTSFAKKVNFKNEVFEIIKERLKSTDLNFINPSDVDSVDAMPVEYRLYPLEDGDFIGCDDNGNLYVVTIDPFLITPIPGIEQYLKSR